MEALTPGGALDTAAIAENYAYPDLPPGAPWLRFNFVATLDGIAAFDGHAGLIGNATDQKVMQELRRTADAIIVGAGTIRAEGYVGALVEGATGAGGTAGAWRPERAESAGQTAGTAGTEPHQRTESARRPDGTERTEGAAGTASPEQHERAEQPLVVVISRTLALEPTSEFFTQAPRRPLLVTTVETAARAGEQFRNVADVLPLGEHSVDLEALINYLSERGLTKLLSEGGPHVFGAFAAQGLADELCLTVSPHLALTEATRITAGTVSENLRAFTLRSALVENSMLFLRYWKD